MHAFGVQVDDAPACYGGKQRLMIPGGIAVPLQYHQALSYVHISYPTDEDLDTLEVIDITSDMPWNPAAFAGAIDHWEDAVEDVDEEFFDTHASHETFLLPMSRREEPPNWDHARSCLLWKSLDVVKKTFEATTQFVKSVPTRLPMCKHFKSRFPALKVWCLREVFATDTFFSSEPALGGITCVQLYTGKTSTFTQVFGMTTENQMPETLQDFIRKWGAPTGLFSDNSKTQTGREVHTILRQYNIRDMQSEPHHQHQNDAERRIQDVKTTTNALMTRTQTPKNLWFLCLC